MLSLFIFSLQNKKKRGPSVLLIVWQALSFVPNFFRSHPYNHMYTIFQLVHLEMSKQIHLPGEHSFPWRGFHVCVVVETSWKFLCNAMFNTKREMKNWYTERNIFVLACKKDIQPQTHLLPVFIFLLLFVFLLRTLLVFFSFLFYYFLIFLHSRKLYTIKFNF